MQKISGILPSSRRVATVDMKNSHPVRPGVPLFGRQRGISGPPAASIDRTRISELALKEMSPKDAADMRIISRVTDGFFMQKPEVQDSFETEFDPSLDLLASEPLTYGGLEPSLNSLDSALILPEDTIAQDANAQDATAQAEEAAATPEYVRAGRYIDVKA